MRKLHIPLFDLSSIEPVASRIDQLLRSGAVAQIDRLNWPEAYPMSLPTTVTVAHDGMKFYLCFRVEGEQLRVMHTRDFDPVWQDSCVEFFMQREGEDTYHNFECNALGAMLAAHRESRESFQRLTEEVKTVFRYSSIQHRYEGDRQLSDWQLYLEIPKAAMGFASEESLSAQTIRANFYKCGDETAEPHYQSWSPIELPNPDFHAPQFFGSLELE